MDRIFSLILAIFYVVEGAMFLEFSKLFLILVYLLLPLSLILFPGFWSSFGGWSSSSAMLSIETQSHPTAEVFYKIVGWLFLLIPLAVMILVSF